MEVAGDTSTLVYSIRKGSNIIQLVHDKETKGYYLHHRNRGKLVRCDYVADNISDASKEHQDYVAVNI